MSGTIDQLNFEVIISDKKFDAQIKDIENKARQFNTSLSNILNIRKISTQMSQKDVENARRVQQAKVDEQRAQEKINREKIKTEGLQRKINAQIERATKGYNQQSRILNELKGYALGYLSIHGASQLLSSLVRVTGEFELQKTTLSAMLGDLNKAEQVITKIQGLAVESPFQFKELTTYAKQLSAFSVPAQELYDTTKMLADISAGLGVGMDRIVLAYGQVRSAAFLRGQEVRQFTEAGIPILEELAKQFSELEGRAVSAGEVFDKISARLVPFEMVAKVFKDMTSEGGKFYNMQEVQAETLRGKISNLKDAYEVMLNEIGKSQSENLKGAVDWARRLMQNYEDTGRTLVELVAAYGIYRTTLVLTSNHITTLTRLHAVLGRQLRTLTKTLSSNPYMALAIGVSSAVGVIYKLGKEMNRQSVITESMSKSQRKYKDDLDKSVVALDSLKAKLDLAEKGSKEYNSALSAIQRNYAPYIEQLKAEGVEIDNLADLYENLKRKVEESARARFVAFAKQDLDSTYAQKISDIINGTGEQGIYNLQRAVDALGLNDAEAIILRMFISGSTTWEEISEKYADLATKVEKAYVSLGAGSSGPMKAKDFLDRLKGSITNLTNEYTAATATVEEFTEAVTNPGGKGKNPTLFVKKVQDTLAKFDTTEDNKGKLGDLWVDNNTNYYDYIDKLRKGYEEVQQKIKDVGATQKANLPDLKKQKEAIEAIAKALDISLDKGDYGKGKSKAQKDLETQIDLVKKLQDAYEKLRPYVNDKTMKDTLAKFFPDAKQEWIDSLDFTTVIKSLADELETYDEDAAKRLRNSIGKPGIDAEVDRLKNLNKEYKDAAEAAGKYFSELRRWTAEDFTIDGEGVAFDIGKIASDLQEKFNEIDLRAQKTREIFSQIGISDTQKPSEEALSKIKALFEKEFGEGSWDKFYDEFLNKGLKAIEDLSSRQKHYERKVAQEKLNDLAKKYVEEQTSSLNLSDWGDKNLSQIKGIGTSILNLYKEINESGLDLTESQKESLASLGLTTNDLIEAIKRVLSGNYNEATIEKFKKIQTKAQETVSLLGDASNAISALGESMDSDLLVGFGKAIDTAKEFTNIILDCDALWESIADSTNEITEGVTDAIDATKEVAQSKDWITMIIKVVLLGVQKIAEAITKTNEFIKYQNELWNEYEAITREIQINEYLTLFDTIFGKDALGSLRANAKVAKGIIEEVINLSKSAHLASGESVFGWLETDPGWWDRTFSGGGNIEKFKLDQLIDSNGLSEEGFKKLQAYYDKGDLTEESKSRAEKLLEYYEQYKKATEAITSEISNLFDSLAADIADNMINAFLEVGDATANLAKGFDNVRESIGKLIMESALIEVMKPYIDDVVKSFNSYITTGDGGKLAEDLNEVLLNIEKILDSDKWTELAQVLQDNNFLSASSETSSSLASGIKGITEDTANLLASYLNAIRADVSFSKTLWIRMDANLQRMAEMAAMSPTLMEYQAQIAANTFNAAEASRSILSELRSVLNYSGGQKSIRVS